MVSSGDCVRSERHLPGESGVWVFILGDMLVFALLFLSFMVYRAADVMLFASAHHTLNQAYGALNTLLMLTSSWFVVMAVEAARESFAGRCRKLLAAAMACGVAFAVVKVFEYGEKISAGLFLTTNDFFMYYYMLTGIHLMHVVIGTGVLFYLWRSVGSATTIQARITTLESGASFWHMVDILWIVLFALLYLLR